MVQSQPNFQLLPDDLTRIAKVRFASFGTILSLTLILRVAHREIWVSLGTVAIAAWLMFWTERRILGRDRQYRKAIHFAFLDAGARGAGLLGCLATMITYAIITIPLGLWRHGQSASEMIMLAFAGVWLVQGLFAQWLRREQRRPTG